MSTNISFTGRVERIKDWGDSTDLSIAIDEGRDFPARALVKLHGSNHFAQGEVVEVTSATMPYPKHREYNGKIYVDIIYRNASVKSVGTAEPSPSTIDDSDIPF